MKDTNEILVIIIDLNSFGFLNFRLGHQGESFNKTFGLEDIVSMIIPLVNLFYLQNPKNKIAYYIFDEETSSRIFPMSKEDSDHLENLSFDKITDIITSRVMERLINKKPKSLKSSCIVEALYQCISCNLRRRQCFEQ